MFYIAEEAQRTLPMDYRPVAYEKHIAECVHAHEDDVCRHGEGSGILIVPGVIATIAAVAFVLWIVTY